MGCYWFRQDGSGETCFPLHNEDSTWDKTLKKPFHWSRIAVFPSVRLRGAQRSSTLISFPSETQSLGDSAWHQKKSFWEATLHWASGTVATLVPLCYYFPGHQRPPTRAHILTACSLHVAGNKMALSAISSPMINDEILPDLTFSIQYCTAMEGTSVIVTGIYLFLVLGIKVIFSWDDTIEKCTE